MSCASSLPPLCVATLTDPRALWWPVVYATPVFLMVPHNSFYFSSPTQTSGILLSVALTLDSWKAFSDSLSSLRRSKLIKAVFQRTRPTPTQWFSSSSLEFRWHSLLYDNFCEGKFISVPCFSLFLLCLIGLLPLPELISSWVPTFPWLHIIECSVQTSRLEENLP